MEGEPAPLEPEAPVGPSPYTQTISVRHRRAEDEADREKPTGDLPRQLLTGSKLTIPPDPEVERPAPIQPPKSSKSSSHGPGRHLGKAGWATILAVIVVFGIALQSRLSPRFVNSRSETRSPLPEGPEPALKYIGPSHAGAKNYCSEFNAISSRYPFNPNSRQDASMEVLYSVFAPTGDLR